MLCRMPIGPTELIIVLVIVLLVVGPKKLPTLGRSLGTGMREFKDSVTGGPSGDDAQEPERATPPLPQGNTPQPPVAPPTGDAAAEPPASAESAEARQADAPEQRPGDAQ